MTILVKKTAAEADVEDRLRLNSNGKVTQPKQKHTNFHPNYGKGCIYIYYFGTRAITKHELKDD